MTVKHTYTVNDARREVRECIEEGYGFSYIWIFLNDLARGKDISWEECWEIKKELAEGTFGEIETSFSTY